MLALHFENTKYMIFPRKRNTNADLEVVFNRVKIERKTEERFLGVIVDEKLKWTKHIEAVKVKMSKYIRVIIYELKHFIPLKAA